MYSLFASFNKLIKFQSAAILLSNVPAYGQSDIKWLGGLADFPRQFVLQAQEPEVRGKQLQLSGDKARSSLLFFPHTPQDLHFSKPASKTESQLAMWLTCCL